MHELPVSVHCDADIAPKPEVVTYFQDTVKWSFYSGIKLLFWAQFFKDWLSL